MLKSWYRVREKPQRGGAIYMGEGVDPIKALCKDFILAAGGFVIGKVLSLMQLFLHYILFSENFIS